MFLRLLRAASLLSMCLCLPSDYEDAIELNYGPSYYNEIAEEETPARKCGNVCACVSAGPAPLSNQDSRMYRPH